MHYNKLSSATTVALLASLQWLLYVTTTLVYITSAEVEVAHSEGMFARSVSVLSLKCLTKTH